MSETLIWKLALPDDPQLDSFDCSNERINAYFRSREWFNAKKGKASPPTYAFYSNKRTSVIGYCAAAFKRRSPSEISGSSAKDLVIFAFGIDKNLHGQQNSAGRTFAASALDVIQGFANENEECKGLLLRVRPENHRAIRFYEKFGFICDSVDLIRQDDGSSYMEMRKAKVGR